MSTELQYNRLHLPGLTVVEKQRQNVKEEMMGFVTALRDDPMALSTPSEGRVGNVIIVFGIAVLLYYGITQSLAAP